MRHDQFQKLQALEEKLLDVFLAEAEPSSWPGQGLTIASMDAKTRGDLYWVRKTAASALMLATKVQNLICTTPPASTDNSDDDKQMDASLASAEKEAAKLMLQLQQGSAGKKAFDRKVHGA